MTRISGLVARIGAAMSEGGPWGGRGTGGSGDGRDGGKGPRNPWNQPPQGGRPRGRGPTALDELLRRGALARSEHDSARTKLADKFDAEWFTVSTGGVQRKVTQLEGPWSKGIDPLAAAGKLGPLLIQFPSSFQRSQESVAYLAWLLQTFAGYQLAVELRHRSWSDSPESAQLLAEHRAAWVQIDEPKFTSSIRQDLKGAGGELYYLRLHGRNAKEWWDHAESEDRYNYFYSEEELEPIAAKVRDIRAMVKKAYLFLNNHFSAQSVANATMLKSLLDVPVTSRMPPELVERFPDLAKIVSTLPRARLL